MCKRALFFVLTAALCGAPAHAQGGILTDEKIAVADLKVQLVPHTAEDLEKLASSWRDLLKGKAQAVADARIAGRDRAAIHARLEERDAVEERFRAVLDSLEAKGGDVEALRKYGEAATGGKLDPTDVGGIWTTVQDWLVSPTGGLKWLLNVVLFCVTLIAFRILSRVLGRVTARALQTFKQGSDLLQNFFVNTVRRVVFFIGLVVALSFLGVPTGPFLAAIGAAGFVIGFALQGTLSNFASGVMILLYRPYDIGNFVSVAGVVGTVKAMTLVSTTLHTGDNQIVVVPNSAIWGDVITNVTGNSTRRVDMTFGIGYGDDIGKAKAMLERLVKGHEQVLAEPEPVVQLNELADSSVNFVCRPWVRTSDYWSVYWDLTRQVKEEFDKEGISIPYPQQDVHMHQVAG